MAKAKSKIEIVNVTLELSPIEAVALYSMLKFKWEVRLLNKKEMSVYRALKEVLG